MVNNEGGTYFFYRPIGGRKWSDDGGHCATSGPKRVGLGVNGLHEGLGEWVQGLMLEFSYAA